MTTSIISRQCSRCAHYLDAMLRSKENEHIRCRAFGGGVPSAILTDKHDHRGAYPGDNGIRFEPIEEA